MKLDSRFLAIVGLIVSTCGLSAADITGKIILKGTPPPDVVIDMSPDPKCAAAHTTPVKTRHYVVAPDGGLADVFVYIKGGLEGKTFPTPTAKPMLDQIGCEYSPYVMGVQVGQTFVIKNSDPTLHNVHALPKNNPEFNFAEPVQGMSEEKSFANAEVAVRFKCDVHPWMFAYMAVVDNPFFAVTGPDGTFTIKNVPPGKYTLAAWHQRAGTQTQEVEVTAGQNKPVNFTFEVKPAH